MLHLHEWVRLFWSATVWKPVPRILQRPVWVRYSQDCGYRQRSRIRENSATALSAENIGSLRLYGFPFAGFWGPNFTLGSRVGIAFFCICFRRWGNFVAGFLGLFCCRAKRGLPRVTGGAR